MFASLKSFASSLLADAETLFNRISTSDQLDRVTAAAALIAYADGTCDADEKQKTIKVIQVKLPHFTVADIAKSWKKAEASIDLDYDFGKSDLLSVIAGANGSDEADLLLRVGILIGGADGDFDDDEKTVVREMCGVLGAKPATYGL